MLKGSSPSKKVNEFIALLKYYGLYQPQDLYKVVCPFHNDKNASLQINVPEAFFYCYAECGAKGSTLELYKCFYKLNNPDKEVPSDLLCWKDIYSIYNTTKLNNTNTILYTSTSTSSIVEKVSYREGLNQARNYYYNLPEANWFRPSLTPTVEEEVRECKRYMLGRGYSPMLLKRSGAKPSLNSNYPIVIPILQNNKFRGYVMRTFDKEIEQQRKYLYNRGFKRERVLAGEFGTKLGSDALVIVEGYLDKLRGTQLGIKCIAAILGWKVSSTQIELMKRSGVKTIVCATDNDEAGRKGYRYFKRIGSVHGFKVVRLHYPKGIKDMGDVLPDSEAATSVLSQLKKFGVL